MLSRQRHPSGRTARARPFAPRAPLRQPKPRRYSAKLGFRVLEAVVGLVLSEGPARARGPGTHLLSPSARGSVALATVTTARPCPTPGDCARGPAPEAHAGPAPTAAAA